MIKEQRVSPSRMARWQQCERQAWHEEFSGETDLRPPHVAMHVGTSAHACMAGSQPPVPPDLLRYDEITPTAGLANLQANLIADCGRAALQRHGWNVLLREHEVSESGFDIPIKGTLDMLCHRYGYDGGSEYAIIDLKTGAHPGAAWLQLGAYALAAFDTLGPVYTDLEPKNLWVGVLHIPRKTVTHRTEGELMLRKAHECTLDAMIVARKIRRLMDSHDPELAPSPGRHCAGCPLAESKCAVADIQEEECQ